MPIFDTFFLLASCHALQNFLVVTNLGGSKYKYNNWFYHATLSELCFNGYKHSLINSNVCTYICISYLHAAGKAYY